MFFGHTLVPVVQHLQPFYLPLPQHLIGDFFCTVEIKDNVTDNIKQIIFMLSDNSYIVLCHFLVLMTGECCHQREQDCGSSLARPHRKPQTKQWYTCQRQQSTKKTGSCGRTFPLFSSLQPPTQNLHQYLTSL